jgi:phage-related protein
LVQGGVNLAIGGINKIIGFANRIPGVNISRLPSISLPRLKVGGIINMPNRGTMVGGAIAGESGAEGVVPLTDSQAMAELGREIGKNVLINLTNVTTMNGRVINRQLRQVKSNQEFAYNT